MLNCFFQIEKPEPCKVSIKYLLLINMKRYCVSLHCFISFIPTIRVTINLEKLQLSLIVQVQYLLSYLIFVVIVYLFILVCIYVCI